MHHLRATRLVNGHVVGYVEQRLPVRRDSRVATARRRESVPLRQVQRASRELRVAFGRRAHLAEPAEEDALQVDTRPEHTRPVQWRGRKRLDARAHFVAQIGSNLHAKYWLKNEQQHKARVVPGESRATTV